MPTFFSAWQGMTATQTYQEGVEWKRKTHKANGTQLVECYAYERSNGTLAQNLERELKRLGVTIAPRSTKEVWTILNSQDNNKTMDGLYELIQTVISLTKSKDTTLAALREENRKVGGYDQIANALLIDIIEPLFIKYAETLKEIDEIDFNDMINQATELVRSGKFYHQYTYVLIDEYQDISAARYSLVKAMRDDKEFALFCVGDDWQSIYRFSGSDIGYILNFRKYWGISEMSNIETTYRFNKSLIKISGRFVMRNPTQIKKSIQSKDLEPVPMFVISYKESLDESRFEIYRDQLYKAVHNLE